MPGSTNVKPGRGNYKASMLLADLQCLNEKEFLALTSAPKLAVAGDRVVRVPSTRPLSLMTEAQRIGKPLATSSRATQRPRFPTRRPHSKVGKLQKHPHNTADGNIVHVSRKEECE